MIFPPHPAMHLLQSAYISRKTAWTPKAHFDVLQAWHKLFEDPTKCNGETLDALYVLVTDVTLMPSLLHRVYAVFFDYFSFTSEKHYINQFWHIYQARSFCNIIETWAKTYSVTHKSLVTRIHRVCMRWMCGSGHLVLHNMMNVPLPPIFADPFVCAYTRYLNLSQNVFTELPDLSLLCHLEELNLCYCTNLKQIPSSLQHLISQEKQASLDSYTILQRSSSLDDHYHYLCKITHRTPFKTIQASFSQDAFSIWTAKLVSINALTEPQHQNIANSAVDILEYAHKHSTFQELWLQLYSRFYAPSDAYALCALTHLHIHYQYITANIHHMFCLCEEMIVTHIAAEIQKKYQEHRHSFPYFDIHEIILACLLQCQKILSLPRTVFIIQQPSFFPLTEQDVLTTIQTCKQKIDKSSSATPSLLTR